MMTREELEAALATTVGYQFAERSPLPLIIAAARKQLALMPEKCGTCIGNGRVFARNPHAPAYVDGTHLDDCPTCHGSGKVYPPETVRKIAKIIAEIGQLDEKAIAVLDALGESE